MSTRHVQVIPRRTSRFIIRRTAIFSNVSTNRRQAPRTFQTLHIHTSGGAVLVHLVTGHPRLFRTRLQTTNLTSFLYVNCTTNHNSFSNISTDLRVLHSYNAHLFQNTTNRYSGQNTVTFKGHRRQSKHRSAQSRSLTYVGLVTWYRSFVSRITGYTSHHGTKLRRYYNIIFCNYNRMQLTR